MSRVTCVDTRHWQVAQTVSHVMLDHMSSSGVMHGDGRWRGEEMVRHEVKRKNIAAVVMIVRPGLLFFSSIPSPLSLYYGHPPPFCLADCAPSLQFITCLTLASTVPHTRASVPADVHPLCTFHAVFPHCYLMYQRTFCARLPTP